MSYQPSFRQGFSPGSLEAIRAVQMEHRYEGKASKEQQAAAIPSVGKRNLAHAWQAQMDARNTAIMRRQLAGRKSAAALDWLLKRQQERQQVEQEQERYTPRKTPASLAHYRASPDNPLVYKRQEEATLSPAEMAAALAAMQLSAQQGNIPAGNSAGEQQPSCTPEESPAPAQAPKAFAAIGCQAEAADIDASADAVAVITDEPEPVAPAPHLVCHLDISSLSPEPQPVTGQHPYHSAAEAAYWKQQEMEELMSALLQEYPHGIPRKMLMDLRHLGINDGPGLGFGCISSSLAHDTVLLSKGL